MSLLIELQHIQKTYPSGDELLHALKNVNLKIYSGELVAIIGASGSGKSTLLNLLGLLDRPTQGHYLLENKVVTTHTDDELAQLRNHTIGFVFQSFYLLPRLSALQNVMLPLRYRHMPIEEASVKAQSALDKFRIGHLSHHKPQQLSGGQQQRVALARALVTDPKIILADEPTGALDSHTGEEVMQLFRKLHQEEKRTIIIVTHDLDIANQCKRIIHIKDGEIISDEYR